MGVLQKCGGSAVGTALPIVLLSRAGSGSGLPLCLTGYPVGVSTVTCVSGIPVKAELPHRPVQVVCHLWTQVPKEEAKI